jgi:hypothetical protein
MSIQLMRRAAFTICILAVGLFAAENPFAGTWKLNAAKSKLAGSGIGPSGGVRVESDGTTYKASVDTTDEKGQPVKFDYEATLDGKSSKVTFNGHSTHPTEVLEDGRDGIGALLKMPGGPRHIPRNLS